MRMFILALTLFAAILTSMGIRVFAPRWLHPHPPTAEIPEPDAVFRARFSPPETGPDWPGIKRARTALAEALAANRYGELDSILSSAQTAYEANPATEPELFNRYAIFSAPNPAWEKPMDDWVRNGGQGYPALTARAIYREALAWKARGNGWISESTTDGLREMNRYAELAEKDALAAVAEHPEGIIARISLIRISNLASSGREKVYAEEAFRVNPVSYQAHSAYLNSLLPRWGGSYPAMESFLRKTGRLEKLNPELSQFRGAVEWDKGNRLGHIDSNAAALKRFDKALAMGHWWKIQNERGVALRDLDRLDEAFDCFGDASRDRPLEPGPLFERSLILLEWGRWDEADSVYRDARDADPFDPKLPNYNKRIAMKLTYLGYQDAKKGDINSAIRKYDRALAADSMHAQAYKYRGAANAAAPTTIWGTGPRRKGMPTRPAVSAIRKPVKWPRPSANPLRPAAAFPPAPGLRRTP